MLGHSFEKYTYEQFGAKSDNYANGAFPSSNFDLINAGPNIYAGNISYTSYALESYFGRIALNWDNKYILNASLRSDGSSALRRTRDMVISLLLLLRGVPPMRNFSQK